MSDPTSEAVRYQVLYSIPAQQRIVALDKIARRRGDGDAFGDAFNALHRRLRSYPQFGEQLVDLKNEQGQVWLGIIRPIAVRYAVFDERHLVIVAARPVLFRPPNLDSHGRTPSGGSLASPVQPNPAPFPVEPIPPDLLEWARQTVDEEDFLTDLRDIEANGGWELKDFIDEIIAAAMPRE